MKRLILHSSPTLVHPGWILRELCSVINLCYMRIFCCYIYYVYWISYRSLNLCFYLSVSTTFVYLFFSKFSIIHESKLYQQHSWLVYFIFCLYTFAITPPLSNLTYSFSLSAILFSFNPRYIENMQRFQLLLFSTTFYSYSFFPPKFGSEFLCTSPVLDHAYIILSILNAAMQSLGTSLHSFFWGTRLQNMLEYTAVSV